MTMTDPIADFLTRLRNANSAYHDEVTLPSSTIKANIAAILKEQGYITDYRVEDAEVGKKLVVSLKYGPSRERSIAGLRRVSKPGLRGYAKRTALPRGLGGVGSAILSTASGLLTDLNDFISTLVSTPSDPTPFDITSYVNGPRVLGATAVISAINIVLFTALGTLGSFLYNLSATMLGGLEVTLAED